MNGSRGLRIAALALALAVSACGGGGGGGGGGDAGPAAGPAPPVASSAVFQVAAAARSWLQSQQTYSQEPSMLYQVLVVEPLADALVPELSAAPLRRTEQRETTYSTMSPAPRAIRRWVDHYLPSPLQYLGRSVYDNSVVVPPSQASAMPETATVGSAGPLYTMPASSNSDTSFQSSAGWSLEADTATSAWLCLNFSLRTTDPQGSRTDTGRYCSKIDPAGNLSGFRLDRVSS